MSKEPKRSITTKRGDQGKTSLFNGTRVSKASVRPETYGTLDEASAFLGLARARTEHPLVKETLLKIQNAIYLANAELACPPETKSNLPKRFEQSHLDWVEQRAAEIEKGLNLPAKFVLYGETETGAVLDMARAVVRRAERALVALESVEPLDNPLIKPFINRLSDLLYLLARFEEKASGFSPRHPDV